MTGASLGRSESSALSAARRLADQTFARAAGAPLIPGNTVRILRDAKENYPAWLEAIASATTTIHFETYIRVLGPAEARVMATSGLLLLVMSGVAMKWPRVVAIPLSVVLGWVALSLFSRAATLHVEGKGLRWPWRGGGPPEPPRRATTDVRG